MSGPARNIRLYPWYKFLQNLMFWQATWFLFFQSELSAAHAILIYVFYDISTTVFEVPSGYMSDRIGRRITLIFSAIAGLASALLQGFGSEFWMFAMAQIALGAHIAFASGTDNSLLYESLAKEGRQDEVEHHELVAWRFSFVALAISALIGGAMAVFDLRIPYYATALAFGLMLISVFSFVEPKREETIATKKVSRVQALGATFQSPILLWLFAFSALMYGFNHLPFIFGPPFIEIALGEFDLQANAPLVAGVVTAVMMLTSVATSLVAPSLRQRFGLLAILIFAFALQVALVVGLVVTGSALAILLLLLRKVPESLSRPFIVARIQPLVADNVRATYLSIQNLVARLLFAFSLFIASGAASNVGGLAPADIRVILSSYGLIGVIALITLMFAGRGRDI